MDSLTTRSVASTMIGQSDSTGGVDLRHCVVCILTSDYQSTRCRNVTQYFNDPNDRGKPPFFIIEPVTVNAPAGIPKGLVTTHRVMGALTYVRSHYPNFPCILIKDTSLCSRSSSMMADLIRKVMAKGPHLFYLCKWLDSCGEYRDKQEIAPGVITVRTVSPNGLQAICFSPQGRDIVLGDVAGARGRKLSLRTSTNLSYDFNKAAKIDGDLIAYGTSGNPIVSIDPLTLSIDSLYKLNECDGPTAQAATRIATAGADAATTTTARGTTSTALGGGHAAGTQRGGDATVQMTSTGEPQRSTAVSVLTTTRASPASESKLKITPLGMLIGLLAIVFLYMIWASNQNQKPKSSSLFS